MQVQMEKSNCKIIDNERERERERERGRAKRREAREKILRLPLLSMAHTVGLLHPLQPLTVYIFLFFVQSTDSYEKFWHFICVFF